jgi:hypothetical protein
LVSLCDRSYLRFARYAELGQTGVGGNHSLPVPQHSSVPRVTRPERFIVEVPPLAPQHNRELILNYFRAQKLLSSGVVEGLNNKAKVTMRKFYGFRTYRVLELALYHSLGKLPESTHDFF